MKIESVRELKANLNATVIAPMTATVAARSALGMAAQPMAAIGGAVPTFALGVAPGAMGEYALAVRIQGRGLENSTQLDAILKQARGESDVRYIGVPVKRRYDRPLKIGDSVGHYKITAGTIGGFVRSLDDGSVMILSNNHVLANENKAKAGDAILQPGPLDGGRNPENRIATLTRFVRLKKSGANAVDAAVATLDPGIEYNAKSLAGLGRGNLAGAGGSFLDVGTAVRKIGRTTGPTEGRVTAFDLDVYIQFGDNMGALRFINQVEIEGAGEGPFSEGGDSGSLIVDADRRAVALLFAGGDQGGSNHKGLTFANPLEPVLQALNVELVSS